MRTVSFMSPPLHTHTITSCIFSFPFSVLLAQLERPEQELVTEAVVQRPLEPGVNHRGLPVHVGHHLKKGIKTRLCVFGSRVCGGWVYAFVYLLCAHAITSVPGPILHHHPHHPNPRRRQSTPPTNIRHEHANTRTLGTRTARHNTARYVHSGCGDGGPPKHEGWPRS
jgi:hypothetical protein